jgi:alkylation response protein AidB-like acyl-CoA dehydrogenase
MYAAPLKDISFVLDELIGADALRVCPNHADYSAEVGAAVLSEAARFAETVLAPLNKPGDLEGAHWSAEGVKSPAGFKDAYLQFVEGGWPQLGAEPEYGGQGVPLMLASAAQEIWASANLAFKLCPMLTHGAVHALEITGSPAQRALYLPKMIRGEWTGTMVLTEPQAGSDLGLIRTRAVPEGDHYRVFGQKIFITWGEHDFTDNIIHMVLARIDGSPPGTRGISLFIVPKVLVGADGALGERNEVRCLSIEHKLGIHASPTCVLAFGEKDGAIGYLVGEPNRGLEYMFIMMNTARLAVGLEGYAVAERAFQQAAEWARTRVQGKPPVAAGSTPAAIIHHPDVKRMLLTMKSGVEAMRALTLYAACQLDIAAHAADAGVRAAAQARGDLLIPIVKGWCTELGAEIASLGIQVHGGMGFIEETGAAQYLCDVRITSIYEGTTGIQANDLIGRKIGRDRGAAMQALIAEVESELKAAVASSAVAQQVRTAAHEAVELLRESTAAIVALYSTAPERAAAVAVPYLKLCGFALGGWLMARAAAIAATKLAGTEREFYEGKLAGARFYAAQTLSNVLALHRTVRDGPASVVELDARLI